MSHTLLFDRSDRLRVLFSGPNAVPTLDGLVTNDVKLLTPGQGCYAAILTAKGKIIADVRILRREDDLLVDTTSQAANGAWDVFKKYVNPRFATYKNVTEELANLTIVGDQAARIASQLAGVAPEALKTLPPFHHLSGTMDGLSVTVLRTPEVSSSTADASEAGSSGGSTFAVDLIVPVSLRESLYQAVLEQGAVAKDAEAWDILRIRAGWPAWGIDMDDTTLPQEANFDELEAVSYTKGCYIGQEPVARIHFRGHVNKSLRVLTIQSETPPPRGAQLFGNEDRTADRTIGDLRSVTPLDEPSHYQGIGMVRREIANGATLTARWEDGTRTAPVHVVRQAVPHAISHASNAKGATG